MSMLLAVAVGGRAVQDEITQLDAEAVTAFPLSS